MYPAFDHILIEVPDLAAARAEYSQLLGMESRDCFRLANVDIQLQQSAQAGAAHIAGLALLDPSMQHVAPPAPLPGGSRGVPLWRSNTRPVNFAPVDSATGIYAVDHLVLQSADADACIALFGKELGLRLALDQEVPEWGGRMLFFRHGKMTLEVIQNMKEPPARDSFWGITYLCHDLEKTVGALDQRGIEHSPIRQGRKPGTRVSTVKNSCLGLPTLLIGQ